jgi:hypothetical protein
MFEYFDIENIDNINIVDVWKIFDISEFIEKDNYIYHELNHKENLMDLSYKYYDTIDDWWVIFLFNNFIDINFSILQDKTIKNTQDTYLFNLNNYDNIEKTEKDKTKYLVRQYYLIDNNLEDSIRKTNEVLNNPLLRNDEDFQESIKQFIFDKLISDSTYQKQIKIPNQLTVYKIKNKFERLSNIWNS